MTLNSLRSKIVLLLTGTLLTIALPITQVSERDVTHAVYELERHAASNTMKLISFDLAARWNALLNDKIGMVRGERARLMETGSMTISVLDACARQVEQGQLSRKAAKTVARDWINRLPLEDRRYALVYDENNRVLASANAALIGQDISALRDFKGRLLAGAMREESAQFGHGFAIYDSKMMDSDAPAMRFAYFGYFGPWNWVIVVTDSARAITEQVDAQRAEMEAMIRENLSRLTLAQSGFIFVIADDGRFIASPPEEYAGLPGAKRAGDGVSLRAALKNEVAQGKFSGAFRFDLGREAHEIEYAYSRPLAWTLVAVVPEKDLLLPARQLVGRQTLIFAAIMLLALFCAVLVAARIVRPLTQLTHFARQLPEQDLLTASAIPEHIAALPARYRDEIGHLAASFLTMDRKLRENVAQLVRETTSRERIESELNIARAIQLGLLPVLLDESLRERVSLSALMRPAKEVGGDLYDYFMLSENELCFVIGDVSGKGVPAALFMAITRTLVRAAAETETDPGKIMQSINDRLSENNPNLMFVTLFLGVLHLEAGDLAYANAGHPPPILIDREGRAKKLEGRSGPACGVQENAAYRSLNARLLTGDTLLGYTDGVTEAVNGDGQQYGEERLLNTLSLSAKDALETSKRLMTDIAAFTAGTEPFDDITLIVVQRP
jgi:sigma-B regulation protein RsbU (phosphoserine phosphatase)